VKNKLIIAGVVLVVLGAAAYYIWGRDEAPKFEWRTSAVDKGDLQVVVTATGTVNAVTTVLVGTQVSGTISKINVDFNSMVKKGEVIAELDKTYLLAALEDSRANYAKMKALLNQSTRDFNRTKQLFSETVLAQSDYDAGLANFESAQTNLRSAQTQVSRAEINLQYATIKAPINGVVISRSIDIGQTVASSFNTPTLYTIANDLTKMQVLANVDEADIGEVKLGQEVAFTVDAYQEDTFKGTVSQIRLQPTVLQSVVTYTVIVDVPNADLKLMPGMTASITINIAGRKNVLMVPKSAVKFKPPREYFQYLRKERKRGGADSSGRGGYGGRRKKNAAVPADDFIKPGTHGRLWIKQGENIKPVKVVFGFSDDSNVEVSGDDIHRGDEVILGAIAQKKDKQPAAQNPFAPQTGGQRGGGGGGRRGL